MFLGTVPTQCISQVFRILDFKDWETAYICCSGSFRIEKALFGRHPLINIHSNDVSLYSTAIGYLCCGKEMPIHFKGRLQFVEDFLDDPKTKFIDRVAAVLVICEMSRYSGKNVHAQKHFQHYVNNFEEFHHLARNKMVDLQKNLSLADYYPGDWLFHVKQAIDAGAGILAFPPFIKGDYEQQYKFIDDNTEWPNPEYDMYDPTKLHSIVSEIHESGVPYCVLSDQVFEDFEPVIEFVQGRKVPHYCYASTTKSSVRHLHSAQKPFRYRPIDLSKITKKSKVQIVPTDGTTMNYIKDVYLAKSIVHTTGVCNFLVYIDGMLVGGLVYSLPKYGAYGPGCIYLLSDVTISREAKLSKFVAKLATSTYILREVERKLVNRIDIVVTTARTKRPVSMKYRGIYKMKSRRPSDVPGEGNIIQYASEPRAETPQQIFKWWWENYGKQHRAELAKD